MYYASTCVFTLDLNRCVIKIIVEQSFWLNTWCYSMKNINMIEIGYDVPMCWSKMSL